MFRTFIILVSLLSLSSVSVAEIYKWVDNEGNVHFTDAPPKNQQTKKVTVKVNSYQSVPSAVPAKSKQTQSQKNPPEKVANVNKRVTIYTTVWCGYCRKAKDYFKQQGIRYREIDIEKSEAGRREYNTLNTGIIPVIFVDDVRIDGFSRSRFEQAYYR